MLREGIFGEENTNSTDFYYRMFRFMNDNTTDIFWCVDLSSNELYFMGQSVDKFNMNNITKDFPHCLIDNNVVYSEDIGLVISLCERIKAKEENHKGSFEIRLMDVDGVPEWYKCQCEIIYLGEDAVLMGTARNIHKSKDLEKSANSDELTGCFNKKHTERFITEFLKYEPLDSQHLFMLVDIDDFKNINDTLGHSFGDGVLKEIGKQLRAIVRKDDIVGRIGGDEFVILLKNMNNTIAVKSKLAEIQSIFRFNFAGKNNNYKVSGSIGIARFSIDGTTFEELYNKADVAMYQAKKSGKDQFYIYKESLNEHYKKVAHLPVITNSTIKFSGKNEAMIRAFKMIQHTSDLPATLHIVLKTMGETLKASRVSIFEFNSKTATWNSHFEWCAPNINPYSEEFREFKFDKIDELISLFTAENVLLCNDTSQEKNVFSKPWEKLNVKAFMGGAYFYENHPIFFLAVEDCVSPRQWSEEDYSFIYFMTNLIAPYLSYENGNASSVDVKRDYYRLKEKLEFDNLTGIPTKEKFFADTVKLLRDYPEKKFFAMQIDVVNFQMVNSYFGVDEGDRLLRDIGKNFRTKSDIILGTYGRINADVFGGCYELFADIETVAKRISESIRHSIKDFHPDYKMRLVAGIHIIENPNVSLDEIYTKTSLAIKECKKHKETSCYIYTDNLMQRELREQEIVNDMQLAITEKQFKVYLQPKVSLSTGQVVGAEALCRWEHPVRGTLTPEEFIPIFEKHGYITQLDYYIWTETCKAIKKQIEQGNSIPISVNASVIDLHNKNIVECFAELLNEYEIPPELLHIEITESVCVEDEFGISKVLQGLRNLGISIEMDDFCSGYSSLNVFEKFPVDILKLDMLFIRGLTYSEKKKSTINLILGLAKMYDIKVVAEGIETEEQRLILKEMGCHIGQGYLFSRPVPAVDWNESNTETFTFNK
ncbi:MAG: EAL domain-containing protein [Anaerovoracaceae bacterium]